MMTNAERRYTRHHNWIEYSSHFAWIGMTELGIHLVGEVVFVELPSIGQRFKCGEPLGSIEAVDAFSTLYAPVSGEIVELNRELQAHPEQLNADPAGTWIVRIALVDEAELDALFDAHEYASLSIV